MIKLTKSQTFGNIKNVYDSCGPKNSTRCVHLFVSFARARTYTQNVKYKQRLR